MEQVHSVELQAAIDEAKRLKALCDGKTAENGKLGAEYGDYYRAVKRIVGLMGGNAEKPSHEDIANAAQLLTYGEDGWYRQSESVRILTSILGMPPHFMTRDDMLGLHNMILASQIARAPHR